MPARHEIRPSSTRLMSPGSGFVDPAAQRNVAMRVVPTLVQTALWRTARAYPSILPSARPRFCTSSVALEPIPPSPISHVVIDATAYVRVQLDRQNIYSLIAVWLSIPSSLFRARMKHRQDRNSRCRTMMDMLAFRRNKSPLSSLRQCDQALNKQLCRRRRTTCAASK